MPTIAGASGYLTASTYSNLTGKAAQSSALMDNIGSDLLEVGRRINRSGIGLSANARALNKQFLNSSSSNYNALFSSTNSAYLSIEDLQKQVLALRASLPDSRVSDYAGDIGEDDASVAADDTKGTSVDIEV